MNNFVSFLLLAASGGNPPPGSTDGPSPFMNLLPLAAIFGIMYFLMIRPQKKKQKETQRMLADLKKGDRVVTIGGLHGVVQTVKENTVLLKVDDNCKVEFNRSAIASITTAGKGEGEESAD